MNEDKYIQSLFEKAKKEPPKLSFEDAASRFTASVPATGLWQALKKWMGNNPLNFNAVIMILSVSTLTVSLWFFVAPGNMPLAEVAPEAIVSYPLLQDTIPAVKETPADKFIEQNISDLPNESALWQGRNKEKLLELDRLDFGASTETTKTIDFSFIEAIEPPAPAIETIPAFHMIADFEGYQKERQAPGLTLEKIDSLPSGKVKIREKRSNGFLKTVTTNAANWEGSSKTFQKEFDINPGGTTRIINESGKVDIQTWDRKRVKIKAMATVKASKSEKAKQILENIEVQFSNSLTNVKAETIVKDKKRIKWRNRKNWDVSIDYEVWVPQNGNISVYQYNGDVTLGELLGKAEMELRFADLEAKRMGNDSKVIISNGQGNIERTGNLFCQLQFAKLYTGELGDVDLDVRHSTLHARKAKNVGGRSNYGKYEFGIVHDYEITGVGDEIKIGKAQNVKINDRNAKIYLDYGEDIEADLSFSKLYAKELGETTINCRNSTFEADKAKNINSQSTYSNYKFGAILNYDASATGGKTDIGSVRKVKLKGNNTTLTIDKATEDLDLDMRFGSCKAVIVNPLPKLKAVGRNTSFTFEIPKDARFDFDLTSNTKNYSYPEDLELSRQIEKIGTHELEGFYGDKSATNQIKAQLEWGKLKIEKGAVFNKQKN